MHERFSAAEEEERYHGYRKLQLPLRKILNKDHIVSFYDDDRDANRQHYQLKYSHKY